MNEKRSPDSLQPPEAGRPPAQHGPNSVPPRWSKRILLGFLGLCVAAVVAGFLADIHGEHPWEEVPLFHALYGFLGISGLILVSKALRRLVMRPEDYYDDE